MVATVGTFGLGTRLFGTPRRPAGRGRVRAVRLGHLPVAPRGLRLDDDGSGRASLRGSAVRDAQRHRLLWAPAVGILLRWQHSPSTPGLVYAPIVAALARDRRLADASVADRAPGGVACSQLAPIFFFVSSSGATTVHGIAQTTMRPLVIRPSTAAPLIGQMAEWVGPWLVLAASARAASPPAVGAVRGPARRGRDRSAAADPHRRGRLAVQARRVRHGLRGAAHRFPAGWAAAPRLAHHAGGRAALRVLAAGRVHDARGSSPAGSTTGRCRVLRRVVADRAGQADPGRAAFGQRYALRDVTKPRQWNDTYSFGFNGFRQAGLCRAIDAGTSGSSF